MRDGGTCFEHGLGTVNPFYTLPLGLSATLVTSWPLTLRIESFLYTASGAIC